ncbi:MAG: DMT family transporter [bacterium]|nr:DMT family transporter [bacterium]
MAKNINKSRVLLELNFATLLLSVVALFLRVISLSATFTALFRAMFAAAALFIFILLSKQSFRFKNIKEYLFVLLLGILFSAHWVAFFYSVKISSVAVSMIAVFTFPIMTVFLEPLFFRQKIRIVDIFIALAVLFGVILVVPEFNIQNDITRGVLFGLLSALLYSMRLIVIKKYLIKSPSSVLMFYQVFITAIVLSPMLYFYDYSFHGNDLLFLILLGVIFTALAHTMFIRSLRSLKVKTASIITGIQPVYATILAIFILNEIPSMRVVFGGIIIVFAVIFESVKVEARSVDPSI